MAKKVIFKDTSNNDEAVEPKVTEVLNANTASGASKYIKIWKGTAAQYSSIPTLDPNTIYFVEQEI